MMATAKQTLQAKNILKVKEIVDIAYEYVETNLSISVIKDYVPYAVNIDVSNIKSEVLPGNSYGPTTTPSYPLWFFVADKAETAKLVEELYGSGSNSEDASDNSTNTTSSNSNANSSKSNNTNSNSTSNNGISKTEASKIKIEILNGSGSTSTLTEVKKALSAKGYKVTKTTATTNTSKTTIINKSDVETKFIVLKVILANLHHFSVFYMLFQLLTLLISILVTIIFFLKFPIFSFFLFCFYAF